MNEAGRAAPHEGAARRCGRRADRGQRRQRHPLRDAARLAAAALISLAAFGGGCAQEEGPARPDILLITLDTTRADRIGCYGYRRPTTPNLDRLCRHATVYDRAYSTSSWTLSAHASLFTGKLPSSHGMRHDAEGPLALSDAIAVTFKPEIFRARPLAPEARTLAEILAGAGYATAAIVGGPWLKPAFGLDRGFSRYDDDGVLGFAGRPAEDVTERALEWIRAHAGAPFFLFLNFFDPHAPYRPPDRFASAFLPPDVSPREAARSEARKSDLYDGEIRRVDHHVGRILDELRERGLYDNTWIIVTSDHGELFGEHGRKGHGRSLHEPLIRVPLIVKEPRRGPSPARRPEPIQITRILPMVLERLSLPLPAGLDATPEVSGVLAEVYPIRDDAQRALIDGDYKFVWHSSGRHELFDLGRDPGENRNLARHERRRARAMEERLRSLFAALPKPGRPAQTRPLDPETRRALEDLGYLR